MPRYPRPPVPALLGPLALLATTWWSPDAAAQPTEDSAPAVPSERAPSEAEPTEPAAPSPSPAEAEPAATSVTEPPEAASSADAPTTEPAAVSEAGSAATGDGAMPNEPPPPVAFPTGETSPGEMDSQDAMTPEGDAAAGSEPPYSDHALVAHPSSYRRHWDFTLGLQYAWLKDQLAIGLVGAFGQDGFWLDLETAPVFTLKSAPELDGNYLGQRWGLAVFYAPLDTREWRARIGLGGDAYALWGINSEEWKGALALRADVTYWPTKHFGVELGVRGYPFSSDGLSVERGPGGAEWLPFFLTTTLHFRSPGERR